MPAPLPRPTTPTRTVLKGLQRNPKTDFPFAGGDKSSTGEKEVDTAGAEAALRSLPTTIAALPANDFLRNCLLLMLMIIDFRLSDIDMS